MPSKRGARNAATQPARQPRQALPEMMLAYATGITAPGLPQVPWDCWLCTWVPAPHGVPGAYRYGPEMRLKYPSRWCPSHGRYAGG